MSRSTFDRFWSKVDASAGVEGCWPWLGHRQPLGYGQFQLPPIIGAHRQAYSYLRGPIPEGLVLDHLCRNPCCVNPWHLEAVTHQVNCARGFWGTKTHCPHGHLLDGWLRKKRTRYCRTCANLSTKRQLERPEYRAKSREWKRAYKERQKALAHA